MRLPMNLTGVPADRKCIMTNRVAGSSSAAVAPTAEARRHRLPMVKSKRRLSRRKRAMIHRDSGFVPPPLPPHMINQESLVFLFCKKLQNSDVNSFSRTVLPKHWAETHLPRLFENESITLSVKDMDGVDGWSIKFRYWPNNKSRMYVFEGTGPFTRKHQLQTGDYMLIYEDTANWNYVFRAVKASELEGCANKEAGDIKENKTDSMVLNNGADLVEVDILDFDNFPEVDTSCLAGAAMDEEGYFSDDLGLLSSWDEFEDYYCQPTAEPKKSLFVQ